MINDLNRTTLIGYLAADAEVKTANGKEFVTFNMATNSRWKDTRATARAKLNGTALSFGAAVTSQIRKVTQEGRSYLPGRRAELRLLREESWPGDRKDPDHRASCNQY
jgi:hypothetical protein